MRSMPSCECLCSEFSLAQQKRTKEGLGPVLAGQRGSAHRTDMKISGFIRQHKRRATATWKDAGGKKNGAAGNVFFTGLPDRSQRAGGNMVGNLRRRMAGVRYGLCYDLLPQNMSVQ